MGVVEGNKPAHDNDWETVKRGGDPAIQRWIDDQLNGKSCTVVLIGTHTAGRPWINYEITKTWNDRKGLVGIHIHNLPLFNQGAAPKGGNPFEGFSIGGTPMPSIVRTYDPPGWDHSQIYGHIRNNLSNWIEEAIAIRAKH
jgi:Cu/Zn superoxide dismutase